MKICKVWTLVLLCLAILNAEAQEYHVTPFAGGGNAEGVLANTTSLYIPNAITVDNKGNIYIADSGNNRVRRIDASTGLIYTIAGDGRRTSLGDENLARDASLRFPAGIVRDTQGNIFVSDISRIRKINTITGIITTVAGKISSGYGGDGNVASEAQFSSINGLAIDSKNNLYICDRLNRRIRKIDAETNIITTIAGGGNTVSDNPILATDAKIELPTKVTLDNENNVYFTCEHQIKKIEVSTGLISTIAGTGDEGFSGDGGLAINAQLNRPNGIAIDSNNNIYIADNKRIRKIDANTKIITTVAGGGTHTWLDINLPANHTKLLQPRDVVIDKDGDIYITDGSTIRKINVGTGILTKIAGTINEGYARGYSGDGGQAIQASLDSPQGIAVMGDELYIADTGNDCIRKINLTSGIITTIKDIQYPIKLATDEEHNFYVIGSYSRNITKINIVNNTTTIIAGSGTSEIKGDSVLASEANVGHPRDLVLDKKGNLYFTSPGFVRKVNLKTNLISTIAGNGTQGFSGDGGLATNAQINAYGIAVDSSGNVYTSGSSRIRKIDIVTGIISTVIDYTIAMTIAFDKNDNLYGISSNIIQKLDIKNNRAVTIAGSNLIGYSKAGVGTTATVNGPRGITIADDGTLYVSDASHQILKISPSGPDINLKNKLVTIRDGNSQDFGSASLNSTKTIHFTIENKGNIPLMIQNAAITGDFNLLNTLPDSINPGDSIQIAVKMNTNNAGDKNGTLSIANNDLDEQNYTTHLFGQVQKANQLITFGALQTKVFENINYDPKAASSAGLPITYQSSNPAVVTVIDGVVTIVGAGITTITATQNGNQNYHAAPPVQQVLVINKASQTIHFDTLPLKNFGDPSFLLNANASSGLGITYTSSNPNVATVLGNSIDILNAGITIITAHQAGNDNYHAASGISQVLIVNKKAQNIVFNLGLDSVKSLNSTPFALQATSSSGLSIAFTSSNPEVAIITGNVIIITGQGHTTITASQLGNDNYLPAPQVTQQLRVTIGRVTNLLAEIEGRHAIRLSWVVNLSQIRQTRLERSTGSPDNFQEITTVNDRKYVDHSPAIRPGITYYYRAIARGDGGVEAVPSDIVGVKIPLDELVTGKQKELQKAIRVYPNPSKSGRFKIRLKNYPFKKSKAAIVNPKGKLLKFYHQLPATIDLRSWAKGVYYLNIVVDKVEITKKLLKE